nr:MAG TPA: hypothetical protein [Caudoviricetes sp.]
MTIKDESYDKEHYAFELLMTDREYDDIKVYIRLLSRHIEYNYGNMSIIYHMSKKEVAAFPSFYERMRNAFGMNESKDKQRWIMKQFRNRRATWTLGNVYAELVLLDYQVYDDEFNELAQKCKEYNLKNRN